MKIKLGSVTKDLKSVNGTSMEKLFELAGYNYTKFDSASPQSFFDAKGELGIKDHYGWFYGDPAYGMMGRPLGMAEIFGKLIADGKLFILTDAAEDKDAEQEGD